MVLIIIVVYLGTIACGPRLTKNGLPLGDNQIVVGRPRLRSGNFDSQGDNTVFFEE